MQLSYVGSFRKACLWVRSYTKSILGIGFQTMQLSMSQIIGVHLVPSMFWACNPFWCPFFSLDWCMIANRENPKDMASVNIRTRRQLCQPCATSTRLKLEDALCVWTTHAQKRAGWRCRVGPWQCYQLFWSGDSSWAKNILEIVCCISEYLNCNFTWLNIYKMFIYICY